MILDAITSSPLNLFFTIVLGLGLVYLYYRKPSSSSSSSTSSRTLPSGTSRTTTGFRGGVIDEDLQRALAQIERQERDMIRKEQDEAYQMSLRADREKQLRKEEELKGREARERVERERRERQENLQKRLTELRLDIAAQIQQEPSQDQENIVKLVFKLPDGTRVKRIFRKEDRVKHLYWFVFSLANAPLQFKMTTNFPKRDLPGRPPMPEDFDSNITNETNSVENNCEQSLEEAGLTETQILFVYDLDA